MVAKFEQGKTYREAYSRRFAHLAVALLEYHPDTRTITVHELDNQ